MSVITHANLNSSIDQLVRYYLLGLGSSTAPGYGIGEQAGSYGMYDAASDLEAVIAACGDVEVQAALAAKARTLKLGASAIKICGDRLNYFLRGLEGHILAQAIANIYTLDDYLTLKNTGEATKWQTLQHNNFREVYNYFKPGRYPAVNNLFFEVLQGATYADALGKLVAPSTFTDGVAIDDTKYAGGYGQIYCSSLASGPTTITVTGDFYDPATKAKVTGKTATAVISLAGTRVALAPGGGTPAPTDSLLLNVTGMSRSGIVTGTFYAEAARPSGRSLLP